MLQTQNTMPTFDEQRQLLLKNQQQHKDKLNQTWDLVQQLNTPRNRIIALSIAGAGLGFLLYKSFGTKNLPSKDSPKQGSTNSQKAVSQGFLQILWLKAQEELGTVLWDLGRKWLQERLERSNEKPNS